jgi:aminoglycoside phosphotransferase (APT) family kinase protein
MTVEPDGIDVVRSGSESASLVLPPLLVLDALEEYLDERGLGRGPVAWQRVGDGKSNVTYRIARGDVVVALRRGPRPPHPPSTHDMLREAAIQKALRAEGVPVPQIVATCPDDSVLGAPFYLMEWLDGIIVTDSVPALLMSTTEREQAGKVVIEALATLHAVDVSRESIAWLGRPTGYLERQVARFTGLWEANATRVLPAVERVADLLAASLPATQCNSVVHGDYRFGNVMLARTGPVRVRAVLDWELATLGDPLADLGYLTATYSDRRGPMTPMHLTPVTARPGFPTSVDLVRDYGRRTGLDLTSIGWYQALALFKAAVFCEAIYGRWLRGERPDDRLFAPSLDLGVPALLDAARAALAGQQDAPDRKLRF